MAEEKSESAKEELQEFESRSANYVEQEEFVYNSTPKKKKKRKNLARSAPLGVVGVILLLLPLVFSLLKRLYPFQLSGNLVSSVVEFADTIIDKIAYTLGFYSDKGEIPTEYADSLRNEGIEVGKEDADGNFINTNRVIASGDEFIVADTDGDFVVESGTLELRFNGKTYHNSEEIINGLKTDGEFYWAFRNASGGDSLFFYDRSGEDTFTDMGINRDPYHDFESKTKEIEEDESYDKSKKTAAQLAFEELFADAVNYDPSLSSTQTETVGEEETGSESDAEPNDSGEPSSGPDASGDDDDDGDDEFEAAMSSAEEYIKKVANQSRGENATQKAAALINAAISANEPYQASRASSSVVIAAEQAKAGDNGPINELANFLTASETKTITNPDGTQTDVDNSVSSAKNLIAVVGKTEFSVADASEYSRDRVSTAQDVEKESLDTTVSIFSGFKKFLSWIIGLFTGGEKADVDALMEYQEDVARSLFLKPSESMHGKTLGEKITEGGAFLNANLSKNAGASNASSESKIVAYNSYTKDLADRRIAAERAVKSPFDISSSNTFLGSIVNSLYVIETDSNSLFGKFAKTFSLASTSFSKLTLGAYANGSEPDTTYLSKKGTCPTLESLGAKGDIYCNQIATYDVNSTINGKSFLESTIDDYAEVFKGSTFDGDIEFDGDEIKSIRDNSKLAEYVILGSGRESTPGVKDANVCQAKKEGFSIGKFVRYIFGSASEAQCDADPDSEEGRVATGLAFADVEENKGEWDLRYVDYQGYFLTTYALELTGYYDAKGESNPIVALKEDYYEKHPKDNSFAGVLARRTGWSKADVLAGLEAINYLAYLNNYDPSSRLSFVETLAPVSVEIKETPTPTDTRLADKNKIVFDEKRNRVVLI